MVQWPLFALYTQRNIDHPNFWHLMSFYFVLCQFFASVQKHSIFFLIGKSGKFYILKFVLLNFKEQSSIVVRKISGFRIFVLYFSFRTRNSTYRGKRLDRVKKLFISCVRITVLITYLFYYCCVMFRNNFRVDFLTFMPSQSASFISNQWFNRTKLIRQGKETLHFI